MPNNMSCAEARPLLDAYFDSELDLTASLNVERHAAGCASCAQVLRNLESLRAELTPEVFNRVQDVDLERMRRSVRKLAGSDRIVKPVWRQTGAWAALAAATLILAVFVPLQQRPTPGNGFSRELLLNSH